MRTEAELKEQADRAIVRLKAGECIITDDEILNAIIAIDDEFPVCSAKNRRQLGTKDQYVCWAAESAKPADMTYDEATMVAYADPPK